MIGPSTSFWRWPINSETSCILNRGKIRCSLSIILTTMLACILREFCVSLPPDQPDVEPVVGIVVSPRSDLRLNARRLDAAEQRREL